MAKSKKKQKDKQRSTTHTCKTKDRVTQTPLKPEVNSDAPERYAVPAALVTNRRGNLVINPMTSHEWGIHGKKVGVNLEL